MEIITNLLFNDVELCENIFEDFEYLKCIKDLSFQIYYLHKKNICFSTTKFDNFLVFNKVYFLFHLLKTNILIFLVFF